MYAVRSSTESEERRGITCDTCLGYTAIRGKPYFTSYSNLYVNGYRGIQEGDKHTPKVKLKSSRRLKGILKFGLTLKGRQANLKFH